MRRLLFFSRVALICNICFLVAFCFQLSKWIHNEQLLLTIVNIGYVLGFLVNPFVNIAYLVVALWKRSRLALIPAWLITANVLFLVMQVLFIFYLNDTGHS